MTIAAIGDVDRAAGAADERRLAAAVTAVSSLGAADVDDMFDLYATYYDGTTRALFERDLGEKHWVVALHAGHGALAVALVAATLVEVFPGHYWPLAAYIVAMSLISPLLGAISGLVEVWSGSVRFGDAAHRVTSASGF